MGRPTEYDPAIADLICERVAEGDSLRKILRDDETLPARSTIHKWLRQQPTFADQYARAREDQADYYADQIVEIADSRDDDPNSRRIRVDARKWVASKLKSKAYGDRSSIDHSSQDGTMTQTDPVTLARAVMDILRQARVEK